MEGRAFLKVARDLARIAGEAHRRAAIGRAYYALMLESRDLLTRWGISCRSSENVHHFVRLKLLYARDAKLKDVGVVLERLLKQRNHADYQLSNFKAAYLNEDFIESMIIDADKAIALLDWIDGDPTRRESAIASILSR